MEALKNSLTVLSVLLVSVIILCIMWYPFASNSIFSQTTNLDADKVQMDELEEALRHASMANKTVIITIVNKAYVEDKVYKGATMIDIFLDSFWLGENTRPLLDHLLLVAMDQTTYQRCKFLRLNCYKLETDGVDFTGEELYMTGEFVKMMWRRTGFLLDVLKRGYNFVFTDADVMWLRNPFTKLSNNTTEDLQISNDVFNPKSETNPINTGFYFIRSNNRTISLFETWYNLKDNSIGKKDQDVLMELMLKGTFKQLGLNVTFLDTLYFNGFCSTRINFHVVSTFHANCCRTISAKMADLIILLSDWKKFKEFSGNATNQTPNWDEGSKHVACTNSWIV